MRSVGFASFAPVRDKVVGSSFAGLSRRMEFNARTAETNNLTRMGAN
jgi:hypothetical protein